MKTPVLFSIVLFVSSRVLFAQIPSISDTWTIAHSPIQVASSFTIPTDSTLRIEPGVEILLDDGVEVLVLGHLQALGTSELPIQWKSSGTARWGCISIEETGTGIMDHCTFDRASTGQGQRIGVVNAYRSSASVTIRHSTFTHWQNKATQGYYTEHMLIEHCYFGSGANEAVHGVGTPVEIYSNTFDYRSGYNDSIDVSETRNPDPSPIIKYNIFLGGDDDGIDLDNCDAYVEGNLVMNSRGGNHDPIGISGDQGSQPVIVNNVIINCETGIGFKNGADITVINNTIVNCDRGIWLHQNPAHASVLNTIIWGNDNQTSIRLEQGSTIDVHYSLIQGDSVYPGTGNMNFLPAFVDMETNDFRLQPTSPAIDAGVQTEGVPKWDFTLAPRIDIGTIPNQNTTDYVDIGAFEYQPEPVSIYNWFHF